tara:strand:- start:7844 stop:9361 length:1518 start_codon:yes stop_codon:yes gene_type:complete
MIPAVSAEAHPAWDPDDWRLNTAQVKIAAYWMDPDTKLIGFMGGWGCGKTRLAAYLCQLSAQMGYGDGILLTDSMARSSRTLGQELSKILAPIGWVYRYSSHGVQAPHWESPVYDGKTTKVWIQSWSRPSTVSTSANSIEGASVGWAIIDESNQFSTHEPASACLGRIRAGVGKLACLGKPTAGAWWLKWTKERGGISETASSYCNRDNLGAERFDAWVALLSPREYRENILAMPMPPEGSILDGWIPEAWPVGNLTPSPDWQPQPWMRTWVCFDFGVRHPHALIISHDPSIGDGGADVVWGEACPDGASVFDVCAILRKGVPKIGAPPAWPADRPDAPLGHIPISAIYGDRAGRNMRDDPNMTSAIDDVRQSPAVGGLGMAVRYTDKPARVNVIAGLKLLWRLIENQEGKRRLLCTHKLWHYGPDISPRSFAKCVNGYRWQPGSNQETPSKRDGFDHGIDCLRYWAVGVRWPEDVGLREARGAFRAEKSPPALTIRGRESWIDR